MQVFQAPTEYCTHILNTSRATKMGHNASVCTEPGTEGGDQILQMHISDTVEEDSVSHFPRNCTIALTIIIWRFPLTKIRPQKNTSIVIQYILCRKQILKNTQSTLKLQD